MSANPMRMKILAVDDNRTNLHIMQIFLKKLGHEVITAADGQEAVERFVRDMPDLVLLDIMMPVMDGFEAARQIKQIDLGRWVPVIFLSALNRDENLVEGLEAGADDYLTKPINLVVLEAKLRSIQRTLELQRSSIASLRQIKAISDNVLDAIITIDETGLISTVNQSAERIFGWDREEMIGRNVSMLMPEPTRSAHDAYLTRHLESGQSQIVGREREIEALRRNGECFPATLAVSKVILDNRTTFIGVVRDISVQKAHEAKIRENTQQLQTYYERTQREQQLAMQLMDMQLHRMGLEDNKLRYKVIPTENFSGDIVAAARSPSGIRYAMLADATGHGLTAAISVLPMLALFYRMVRQSRDIPEIVGELNQQLKESVPVGRFVGVTLLSFDDSTRQGALWIGGTPDALLIDPAGGIAGRYPSAHLPLGIVDSKTLGCEPTHFEAAPGSQIILFSDGLLEASSPEGSQFGMDRLLEVVCSQPAATRFAAIEAAMQQHLAGQLANDDVSLMLFEC